MPKKPNAVGNTHSLQARMSELGYNLLTQSPLVLYDDQPQHFIFPFADSLTATELKLFTKQTIYGRRSARHARTLSTSDQNIPIFGIIFAEHRICEQAYITRNEQEAADIDRLL